ncbi:hypothetical protein I7I51_03826 [Histoplasma capsulatum]|uniref:Uncharacterized protein n=1 Tax=Ajellomyces capsulatus TaxID=5037 RepID=A0A8A1M6L7_AJECA|nr:hypothetical protein I7I51_03826 [Histoplasma capsulatum]
MSLVWALIAENGKSEERELAETLQDLGEYRKRSQTLYLYHVKFHDAQHLTWLETLIFHIQLESGTVTGAYLNAEARLLLQGRSKSTRRRWADETHDGPSTDMSKAVRRASNQSNHIPSFP